MLRRRHKGLRPIQILEKWFENRDALKKRTITLPEQRDKERSPVAAHRRES